MFNRSNSEGSSSSSSQRLLRASILLGIAVLLLIQLLVTFRGLKSPDAMEQSVIARELARGEGMNSKVLRPYALRQLLESQNLEQMTSLPNTLQPPLPSLVLAPIFMGLEKHWDIPMNSRVYVLDRVVVAVSMLFFIASMGLTYLSAERLFDQRIAGWTLLAMVLCHLLWEVATNALAPMMLLFFFSLSIFLLVILHERRHDHRYHNAWLALGVGFCAGAMVFTHWQALWLLPGLFAAVFLLLRPRALMGLAILPVSAALIFWCTRNQTLTGDFLGVAKSTLQSLLTAQPNEIAQRSYDIDNPLLDPKAIVRFFLHQSAHQIRHLYELLGSNLPACLFFLALLHPFKRPETSGLRIGLSLMWLGAFIGMSLHGISQDETRESQIHHLFIPIFSAYGFALLYVFWTRLPIGQQMGWISRQGIAAIALCISSLPFLINLPTNVSNGIRARGMLAQWPPYIPDSLAHLKAMFEENEFIASDIPWAIAWYSDRPCLWLPMDRQQLTEINTLSLSKELRLSGLLFSPHSTKARNHILEVLQNENSDWSEHLYLAVRAWHNKADITLDDTFPFRQVIPLYGSYGRQGRILMELILFTDRPRDVRSHLPASSTNSDAEKSESSAFNPTPPS